MLVVLLFLLFKKNQNKSYPCVALPSWQMYETVLTVWQRLQSQDQSITVICFRSRWFPCPYLFVHLSYTSPWSPAGPLVSVLVLGATVYPEVKQSPVIYHRLIDPIWELGKAGPGLWRHSLELIKFQSSVLMNEETTPLLATTWHCGAIGREREGGKQKKRGETAREG